MANDNKYFDRDELTRLAKVYKDTPTDDSFNALYPIFKTLIEMVLFKMGGKRNTDLRKDRMNYEDIIQRCFVRILVAFPKYNTDKDAFTYFYTVITKQLMTDLKQGNKLVRKLYTQTDLQNEDSEFNVFDLVGTTNPDEPTFEHKHKALFLKFLAYYIATTGLKRQKAFGEFLYLLLTEPSYQEEMNNSGNTLSFLNELFVRHTNKASSKQNMKGLMRTLTANFKSYLNNVPKDELQELNVTPRDLRKNITQKHFLAIIDEIENGMPLKDAFIKHGIEFDKRRRYLFLARYKQRNKSISEETRQLIYAK